MLIEKPEIPESFDKHHDAYKKMSVRVLESKIRNPFKVPYNLKSG